MPPNSEFVPPSSLGIVPPASRSHGLQLTPDLWLEERKDTDGAEGLWRIFDGIYDFTDFVEKHPGGSEWLDLTKGIDITEPFMVHHISTLPEDLIKKYYVRNAKSKRNYPFTFKKDGFYVTLRNEVRKVLQTLPKQGYNSTAFTTDALLVLMFLFSTLAVYFHSYMLGIVSGTLLGCLTTAAHNYFHQRDNFRMYYFQFSFLSRRGWRISHALSHHIYTNTINDLEISMLEPFLQYLPIEKKMPYRYLQFLVAPFVWLLAFHVTLLKRIEVEVKTGGKSLTISDAIFFILPLFMYIVGGQSLSSTFIMWNVIELTASFLFGLVGLHAAHHHPEIFHDGDTPRDLNNYDWGYSQLDSVVDRTEITGNPFLVLTTFGDHCLHHLFPTIDHGYLKDLYPVFYQVLDKFDSKWRIISQWEHLTGGFQQLARVKPNPNVPGSKNK